MNETSGAEPGPDGARVLVVDDDPNVREVLTRYLVRAGYRVAQAGDGPTGLDLALRTRPDLVVLDLLLPGLDGLDVCTRIRAAQDVPIMMLTALGSESDRVLGLETGADDYLVKPFSPREVTLRVGKLLQRAGRTAERAEDALVDGDLRLDPAARTLTRGGRAVALTVREFDLLAFLLSHPGQAFTRAELMQRVWHWSFGDDSTVTVHARRLREKIERDPSDPQRLLTVWGHGYRYHDPQPGPGAEGSGPRPSGSEQAP